MIDCSNPHPHHNTSTIQQGKTGKSRTVSPILDVTLQHPENHSPTRRLKSTSLPFLFRKETPSLLSYSTLARYRLSRLRTLATRSHGTVSPEDFVSVMRRHDLDMGDEATLALLQRCVLLHHIIELHPAHFKSCTPSPVLEKIAASRRSSPHSTKNWML